MSDYCPVVRLKYKGNTGSGTSLYSRNNINYILTNYHVIKNALREGNSLLVDLFDGSKYDHCTWANPVAYDIREDLALLKVMEDGEELNPIKLCLDNIDLKLEDDVFAIGTTLISPPVFSLGKLIGLEADIEGVNYFVTDASTRAGFSGGAVCSDNGELIGVNARANEEKGFSFFIPIDRIISFLDSNGFSFLYGGGK